MKQSTRTLLITAAVATATLGGIGVASAATTSSSTDDSSIVGKIATKFNLNKSEVQAVFDENRAEHKAEMQADRAQAIKDAVSAGTLTQAQADHISAAFEEIDTLRGDAHRSELTASTRQSIKDKMDALHTWADEQNIDLREIIGHNGPHGHGRMDHGPRFGHDGDADDSTN